MVVNIPSASVEAVENGRVEHRYVAVVGGPDHASPEVDAKVQAINLNPTWTVPTSIIKNEIIPKMQKDPGYLSRQHIKHPRRFAGNPVNASLHRLELAARHQLYPAPGFRQSSNALGNIRINMPNKYAVYMHDTPSKRFFGGDYRFLSHGCVRVEGVFDLAAWLLDGTGGAPDGTWTKDAMLSQVKTGEHEDIKLVESPCPSPGSTSRVGPMPKVHGTVPGRCLWHRYGRGERSGAGRSGSDRDGDQQELSSACRLSAGSIRPSRRSCCWR